MSNVKYESQTSVIIGGDLIFSYHFNTDLWKAMDLLKSQNGFKTQQIITSDVGNVENSTTFNIVIAK